MKIEIPLIVITDSYAKGTGSNGAHEFLNGLLLEEGFDLMKPYSKTVDKENHILICTQESTD